MKIPKAIKKALGDGYKYEFLGKREGLDVWQAYMADAVAGFPTAFLCEGQEIKQTLQGFDALEIINETIRKNDSSRNK